MIDPTKLSTAELCERLNQLALALNVSRMTDDELDVAEAARRLDAMRWRDAGEVSG